MPVMHVVGSRLASMRFGTKNEQKRVGYLDGLHQSARLGRETL